ncbi:hypothetical protein BD626DRAFT_549656 [Schizophyllum amplum]|uniref:RING-type domain-containing protein n=1 Tax=Schizophyllum amplum TaxID=97359 RepID=A0A550C691_9AGAR|nr:hypothetical protein BD626DRAFT_549656 [Auriculariopsis ampla]
MSTQAPASYSVPSTPARLPPSPVATRSTKSVRVAAPTTPQRIPRHRQTQSLSHSRLQQYRTPNTPSTPYTPLSLRSFASVTIASYGNFSLNSPDIERNASKDMSLADIAENWRSRAYQNGIRVAAGRMIDASGEMSSFGDDEDSDRSMSDLGHGDYTQDEVLLPPPFSQSFAPLPANMTPIGRAPPQSSPVVRRRLGPDMNQASLSLMSTPPRNPDVARQLRMKGSMTDPAADRRREPFGIIRSPENSYAADNSYAMDTSYNLFDINEHEREHEYEQEQRPIYSPASQTRYRDRYNPGYEPVFPNLSMDSTQFAFSGPARLSDPFGQSLGSIAEVNEMHHPQHAQPGYALRDHYYNAPEISYQQPITYAPQPSYAINIPAPRYPDTPPLSSTPPPAAKSKSHAPSKPSSCSVCSRSNTSTLAVLSPCNHPLCSACLTSALNIVGEKDMECAVCKKPVADFKLVTIPRADSGRQKKEDTHAKGKSFFDPLFSSPGSVASGYTGLESAFEMGLSLEATTSSPPRVRKKQDNVVLRIDNVPWDITPPAISTWLQQPVVRVHVLLDRKGKTMSHAFVELKSEEIARAVLRGESAFDTGVRNANGKYERSTVLGSGKRARGVTVTRSGQEELMRALFPSWQGGFDGSRPSLAGLDNEAVIRALETGLMTQHEVASLMSLIKSPESPFLKVPCLPFYSLASILSKFPSDVDSRVFWPTGLRDALYDISLAAIHALDERMSQAGNSLGAAYSKELVVDVMRTAVNCQAFTNTQRNKLSEVISTMSASQPAQIETPSPASPASDNVVFDPPSMSTPRESPLHSPAPRQSYGDLAKELGIDSELVAAVANRLHEYR